MNYQSLDESSKYITLLLKGAPGSGKTYKAAEFPAPVIFNFDHNLRSLSKLSEEVRENIKIIDPCLSEKGTKLPSTKVWDNFLTLLEKVGEDSEVKTIIIDSLTTAQEYLMDKIVNSGEPSVAFKIQDWGTLQRYWKVFAENVLCNPTLDKHIVITAHEKTMEEESPSGKSIKYGLNMGGSMRDSFDLYFSDVWRLYVDNSKGDSRWMVATVITSSFSAKTSLDIPRAFEWDSKKEEILGKL